MYSERHADNGLSEYVISHLQWSYSNDFPYNYSSTRVIAYPH